MATASTSVIPSVRRTRRLRTSPTLSGPQDEPDAAHGVQPARPAVRLELAPQVPDEDVDDVRPRVERVAPDLLVQLAAVDDLAGPAHEEVQQVELAARELEVAAGAARGVRARGGR